MNEWMKWPSLFCQTSVAYSDYAAMIIMIREDSFELGPLDHTILMWARYHYWQEQSSLSGDKDLKHLSWQIVSLWHLDLAIIKATKRDHDKPYLFSIGIQKVWDGMNKKTHHSAVSWEFVLMELMENTRSFDTQILVEMMKFCNSFWILQCKGGPFKQARDSP